MIEKTKNKASSGDQDYFVDTGAPKKDAIDLLSLWRVFYEKRTILVFSFVVGLLVGVGVALKSPVVYRAELLMVLGGEKGASSGLSSLAGQFGGLASLTGINLGGGNDIEELLAKMRSRSFIERFIKEEDISGQLIPGKSEASDSELALTFSGILKVARRAGSNMVTVAIEYEDPELAAKWANRFVQQFNIFLRNQAIMEAEESIGYLTAQLEKTSVVGIQQALFNLIESQTKTIMLAKVSDEYAFKVVDPAYVPDRRIRPKRKIIVLMSGVIGFIAAAFYVALLWLFKEHAASVRKE